MMFWNPNGMGAWGYALMAVCMVLFWALLIAGVVPLVRYLTRGDRQPPAQPMSPPTPEQVLADRFARSEIDEQDYHQRLNALRDHAVTRA